MKFKENLKKSTSSYFMKIAQRAYRYLLTPFSAICYYGFHKKLLSLKDQRIYWENRCADGFLQLATVENDPYYQGLDAYIFDKLKVFDSSIYLEVGCYFGYRLNKFAGKLKDKKFIGLDLGAYNLSFAKDVVINADNIGLFNANAAALPFKNNSIETIYTVVCLTHIDFLMIDRVLDDIIRVCSRNLLLIEVDHRPMKLLEKMNILNWREGYMHAYEKIVNNRMKLISISPLYDAEKHPRYTAFHFIKSENHENS